MNNSPSNIFSILLLLERYNYYHQHSRSVLDALSINGLMFLWHLFLPMPHNKAQFSVQLLRDTRLGNSMLDIDGNSSNNPFMPVVAKQVDYYYLLGLKKKLFVSCNGLKKYRIGRSVKSFFFCIIFLVKKCVFYACFMLIGSWEGGKNFRVGIILNKKLVRVGLQDTNNFFRPYLLVSLCLCLALSLPSLYMVTTYIIAVWNSNTTLVGPLED